MLPLTGTLISSGVTQVEISQQSLVEIASRRQRVLQPVKSAFFADKRHTFLIARIYESLVEDAVAITVRAFHERELAAHWLGARLRSSVHQRREPDLSQGSASGRTA